MNRLSSLSYPPSASAVAKESQVDPQPEAENDEMTISQMSRLYGVSLRTLRFYEDRGLIKPRREGNARYYRNVRPDPDGHDREGQEARLHAHRNQRFDRRQRRKSKRPTSRSVCSRSRSSNQISHLERQREEIDGAIARLRATHNRVAQDTPPDSPAARARREPGVLRPHARGLDNALRRRDRRLDAQGGRVELDGVLRRAQRRRRTPGIAGVALDDIGQDRRVVGAFAALRQFERPALGARRRRSRSRRF